MSLVFFVLVPFRLNLGVVLVPVWANLGRGAFLEILFSFSVFFGSSFRRIEFLVVPFWVPFLCKKMRGF